MASGVPEAVSASDPLSSRSDPTTYWSRTNAAEQSPGVLTPLGWSVWGPAADSAVRRTLVATGAAPRTLLRPSAREEERTYSVFFGRPAHNADFLMRMGDAIPGTSGAAVAEDLLNFVPPDVVSTPNRRRYPMVAARMPLIFARIPRHAKRNQRDTTAWYHSELARIPMLDLDGTRSALVDATDRLRQTLTVQSIAIMCGYQPAFEQIERLAASVDMDTAGLLSGYGAHAESALVEDLWACSRGRLEFAELVHRHGYHGPDEGALHATVWREDPSPLQQTVKSYAELPEDADPVRTEQRLAAERVDLERRLVASLPRLRRPMGRAVLALAHAYLPLRGVGKAGFLQALDVARAASRVAGTHLRDRGALDDVDDVFYLTVDEICTGEPQGFRRLVAARRERREEYLALDLPDHWQGNPEPVRVSPSAGAAGVGDVLRGIGASPGIVEATVRVVVDPALVDIEPGDVLVARTTDPSWASVMFLSCALVVDSGGMNSHAAVVARELGIPCVMGVRDGTRSLRDGSRCRVDGAAGTVEVLATP